MDLAKIQNGDRFLYAGTSFISKAIIYWMKQYVKKFTVNPFVLKLLNGFVGSHSGTLFWVNGTLYIYDSISIGYKPEVFADKYNDSDNFLILRTKVPYTQSEATSALWYAMQLVAVSVIYAYWDLGWWITYITTGVSWMLKWGGTRAEYCFESTYRILNHVRPDTFTDNPQVISFYDLVQDDDIIVIDNRK